MRNLGGAVNLAPSFSVAFWRNLYKFNAKISAVKFAVLKYILTQNLTKSPFSTA